MILISHDSLLHLSDNSMTCFDLSSKNFKATATFQLNQTQSNFLRQQFIRLTRVVVCDGLLLAN